jgi:hypothetical protein
VVLLVEIVLAVLVLVGVAVVASRDVSGLDDADSDRADIGLPEGRLLRSDDVDRLRFRVVGGIRGVRGYRFADVDDTLDLVMDTLLAHVRAARTARTGPGGSRGSPSS